MAASKRQQILEAVKARLEAIRVADDFNTDAGDEVQLGEVLDLGPDDPDAAACVVPLDDTTTTQGHKHQVRLPIELQAVVKVDLEEPWVLAEAMLADIKKAFELEDKTLGGLTTEITRGATRGLAREPGMTTAGVGVTYTVLYQETWGAP